MTQKINLKNHPEKFFLNKKKQEIKKGMTGIKIEKKIILKIQELCSLVNIFKSRTFILLHLIYFVKLSIILLYDFEVHLEFTK